MNKFRNKGLFILLALGAFLMLALASYTLSAPSKSDVTNTNPAQPSPLEIK